MVFAVMKYYLNILLLIITFLFISSCNKKTDYCEPQYTIKDFVSPYDTWFENLPLTYNTYFNIISVDSLSDAFHFEKYNGYQNEVIQDNDPCFQNRYENVSLYYSSNIYRFSINICLQQMNDGIHFFIRDNGSLKYDYIEMNYNITTDTEYNITYYENGSQTSTNKVSVEIIPSVISNNIEYFNVYKITNNLTLNEGNNFDISVIYIDTMQGIVQFGQKCGTIWDIEL
jgi:hypothetical protein